ncbi:hypothetical protein ABPG73_006342 [Tetrahymena malaccensis]
MDQQKLQKFHNCSKHSQKKIKFIQVNQVNSNPSPNLFYCTECINEDLDFKGINYLLIEQIIQQGENQISILNDLEFLKGSFNDGDQRIQILKNDLSQYEITINEQQYQGQKKIQLKTEQQKNFFLFGLMQEKNLKVQEGHKDYLFVQFKLQNNLIQLRNSQVDKYLKGNDMQINTDCVIELRIQLNEQIFQVLDYPKYDYKISLKNEKLEKLNTLENLKLFFQTGSSSKKYIIQEALIVTDFDD